MFFLRLVTYRSLTRKCFRGLKSIWKNSPFFIVPFLATYRGMSDAAESDGRRRQVRFGQRRRRRRRRRRLGTGGVAGMRLVRIASPSREGQREDVLGLAGHAHVLHEPLGPVLARVARREYQPVPKQDTSIC